MSRRIIKQILWWILSGCILALFGQLLFGWLQPPAVEAQTGSALPPGIQLEQDEYKPDFPAGITFRFQASLDPTQTKLDLRWLELAFRREGEVATGVRRVNLNADQRTLKAEIKVDTRRDYAPPGTRFSYYWRLLDRQGKYYETSHKDFVYNDTRFNFKERKADLLTVRWYQGDDSFGQAAFEKAQQTINRLSQLYQVKPDRPMVMTLYPDSRTLFTALPPNTQEWVGGQAAPELGTVVLAVAPGDMNELNRTVPHEISHLVIYQATRNPYNVPPKWLDEGLAVLNQEQIDGFMTQAFEQARDKHTLYALPVLNGAFPTESQQSYLAYGQSVRLVQYIIQKYGNAGIEKMLAAFKQGFSYTEIVQAGLGISLEQLDRDWKQSLGYPVSS